MTDVSAGDYSLVGRLGVTARSTGGSLALQVEPRPALLHHGVVRASVLSFLVDAAAGILVDDDPDVWTFTSDMSVRMRPVPVAGPVEAVATVLRRGRRSATCAVELTTTGGEPVATGAIGFAKVPRRDTDPAKPVVTPQRFSALFRGGDVIDRPLREEAGVEVRDARRGEVELLVRPDLHNPAGTLQGALVALVAEAAAEDLFAARFESPAVVTDLDLRYLAQAQAGPVRSASRLLGAGPDAPVEVRLTDTSAGRLTTLVYARLGAVRP